MPYGQFTMDTVKSKLGLLIERTVNLFGDEPEADLHPAIVASLDFFAPLGMSLYTEKGRSELLIAPLFFGVRQVYPDRVSVFSGIDFNIDDELGLKGRCDFILSRSPEQYQLTDPACVLVEAKNENIAAGLPPCLAEMVAAQKFNREAGCPEQVVFGVVSSGVQWRFLKLEGCRAWIDSVEYPIQNPRKIFGILTRIALGPD